MLLLTWNQSFPYPVYSIFIWTTAATLTTLFAWSRGKWMWYRRHFMGRVNFSLNSVQSGLLKHYSNSSDQSSSFWWLTFTLAYFLSCSFMQSQGPLHFVHSSRDLYMTWCTATRQPLSKKTNSRQWFKLYYSFTIWVNEVASFYRLVGAAARKTAPGQPFLMIPPGQSA